MKLSDLPKSATFRPGAYVPSPEKMFGPRGLPVSDTPELERILKIPRRPPVDLESVTARALVIRETAKYARDRTGLGPCRCREINPQTTQCITELLPVQALALYEIGIAQGLYGSITVGAGKSIVDLLALLALRDCPIGLLLVPANLMRQICKQYQTLAEHFQVPKLVAHRTDGDWVCESPGQPVLHVMSHNGISSPTQSDFIDNIQPHAIIIDEVDCFSNLTSSRTIRLNRYFQEHGEKVKFCGLTGSPSDSKIEESAHLIAYALKEKSPMPIPTNIVEEWGRCVNATDNPCPPGALMRLVGPEDEGSNDLERAKNAFSRRLQETAGIIMTSSADVQITGGEGMVRVIVEEKDAPEIPPIIQLALDKVRKFERPDTLAGNDFDEILVEAVDQARCAREVACGILLRWTFPRNEERSVKDEWFAARKQYFSEVRAEMGKGVKFLDSPRLLKEAAQRFHGDSPVDHNLPCWESKYWPWWRDVEPNVKPEPKAFRLHSYLVEDAAKWALANKGIIWYSMVELAVWMGELSGLTVHEGGPHAERLIEADPGDRSIIASINSHGRGRDGLQFKYDQQLFVNAWSSAKRWQQVLARLHRRGQKSECARSLIYLHTEELEKSYKQALRRSDYVETIWKQKQKLKMGI